jgi:predicted lipid-binding transport protein (Tim44 family)
VTPSQVRGARPARDWLPSREWIAPLAGLAAGGLLARLWLGGLRHAATGIGLGEVLLASAVIGFAMRLVIRRWARPRSVAATAVVAPRPDQPPAMCPTRLDRGVRDIRRTDRGFDPARFAGYAGMMFRDVERARADRDAARLRDRLTPEMYAELLAFCDGLRTVCRSLRLDEVDVTAETTEAWQDGDRDYLTAYVAGSMLSHTIEDATGTLVAGSRAQATPIEAFLTFTRPAGLNFWMLSIIQGALTDPGRTL